MSLPATGHEAPSPRHPGHCDDSVTEQYDDSVRPTALPARQLSQTFLSVLLAPASLLLVAALHSHQHTMQQGKPAYQFLPQTLTRLLQVWDLQLLPPRRQRWQSWTLGPVHTYIRMHIQYRTGLYMPDGPIPYQTLL